MQTLTADDDESSIACGADSEKHIEQTLTVDSGETQRMEIMQMVDSSEIRRARGADANSRHHRDVHNRADADGGHHRSTKNGANTGSEQH